MSDGAALAAYLNDHLAGSSAGIQLAQRISRGTGDARLRSLLERFVKEFEEDRDVLQRVMDGRGIARDPAKQGLALAGEWVGRLKHVVPKLRSGSTTLVALEDVELLSLGIEGRALLLKTLQEVGGPVPEGVDLAMLEERARRQREELEPFRLRFASEASSSAATG